MEDLIAYFKVKRNLINLLVLAVLVAGLPLGIGLVRQQQILRSRATGNLAVDFLTKDQGGTDCVVSRSNSSVATCKDVTLRLTGGVSGAPAPDPLSANPATVTSFSPCAGAPQANCGTTIIKWTGASVGAQIRVYEPSGNPTCSPTKRCTFADIPNASGQQDFTTVQLGHSYVFELYGHSCTKDDCSDQTIVKTVQVTGQ